MTDIERRRSNRRPEAQEPIHQSGASSRSPSAPSPAPVSPVPASLSGYPQIPWKVVLVIAIAWVAGVAWLMGISPPPPDTAPPPSGLELLVQTAMFGSWMALLAGVAARHRFLFTASIFGGLVLAGAGVMCLVGGHTGLWIPAQIGTGVGLAALGYGASRIS